uniref:Uncharacterized protein n=1 Tax=Picea glauca TaxID=3330 RepID=A0A101M276_PICGL|nr:hypothetical protein ABT39_MTgene2783 [Picea glauca]
MYPDESSVDTLLSTYACCRIMMAGRRIIWPDRAGCLYPCIQSFCISGGNQNGCILIYIWMVSLHGDRNTR